MPNEFDSPGGNDFSDTGSDVVDSGSFDTTLDSSVDDLSGIMTESVDTSAPVLDDDFYHATPNSEIPILQEDGSVASLEEIMAANAETEDSSLDAVEPYTAIPNSDIPILQEDGSVASLEEVMAANAETEDSSLDEVEPYTATPNSDIPILQEDGSVASLEEVMAANAETEDSSLDEVEPYTATPNSDIPILQEDGSVASLEEVMAANAETEDSSLDEVEPYTATQNSDIPILQEDGSVASLEEVMSQSTEADDTLPDDTLSDLMEQRVMEDFATPTGTEEIKTPNQKIQEQIDSIMGNQNLSDTQKSALLAEIKEMLPNVSDANTDLYASPLQEELIPEVEQIDDGAPVKVLTLGGNGTGISHHDYQQELADLDQGIANWQSMQQELANSLNEEITGIQTNPDLSDAERDILLQQAEQKKMLMAEQWDIEATQLMAERDLLQQKANASMQDVQTSDAFNGTPDISSIPEASDVIPEIQKAEEVSSWINEINPNFDPYDWDSPYCNNCGSCAFAVEQRFEGNSDIAATSENIGTVAEMNALTGMEQVAMSPEEIQDYLISQGPGSHGIVGIDRVSGPGHWFNAYYDGQKVVAIDGQTGQVSDWPPDYGDVTNWDISVRKEVK